MEIFPPPSVLSSVVFPLEDRPMIAQYCASSGIAGKDASSRERFWKRGRLGVEERVEFGW